VELVLKFAMSSVAGERGVGTFGISSATCNFAQEFPAARKSVKEGNLKRPCKQLSASCKRNDKGETGISFSRVSLSREMTPHKEGRKCSVSFTVLLKRVASPELGIF